LARAGRRDRCHRPAGPRNTATEITYLNDGAGFDDYGVTLHAELTTDRAREQKQEKNPTRAR